MAKTQPIKPAPPIATDPHLRELELSKRREIARLKEIDMDAGRKESLSVSTMTSNLDTKILRGTKALDTDRKRTDAAHGPRHAREARWVRIAQTYAGLKLEHPGWMEKKLEIETARLCGVHPRTVQTYKHYTPRQ